MYFCYTGGVDQEVKTKLSNFFQRGKILTYKKGEIIIRPEDIPQGVYFVKNGYVRTYALLEDGREVVLTIAQHGGYFPVAWALGNQPNHYYFEALSDTVLQRVSKVEILEYLTANPDILFELIKYITDCQDRLLIHIEKVLSGTSKQRVMAMLSILAGHFGEENKQSQTLINIPLTHQDIANLTCLTRETVSMHMSKLKKKKLLWYNYNQVLVDLPKLDKELEKNTSANK
ncbi:hypothetical protein A2W14_03740 [Candidatus Gottesmanbacteria bacterium RBG_16_37_8]|uniref:HTH crp-type domain-containing protein n=1 Tax=Candidatus Gottesmanbacteria bacterium RBG_16_37_8 TaxID=1798371 RepID=A0A1F5YNC9_9BACT|nr:MAG: hypothetical protein A2W14_03740 [Candidatus Gottesmanbacteria bacterium RBG_16_37_8]